MADLAFGYSLVEQARANRPAREAQEAMEQRARDGARPRGESAVDIVKAERRAKFDAIRAEAEDGVEVPVALLPAPKEG